MKSFCLFLVGPTASGKTALSLELAKWLHADIISADSRQIFRGMDIGTATPGDAELSRVKHYFINERDPDMYFSAGEFAVFARRIIDRKMKNDENIIVCGGSGLYIQAILGMTADTEKSDTEVREKIRSRAEKEGWDALYRELQDRDPDYARKIDAKNPKRIGRALEILETGGNKPSGQYHEGKRLFPAPLLIIGLRPERGLLYRRIDRRVLEMIEAGLVDEVKALLVKGYDPGMNAMNTVGYKEITGYIRGKTDLEHAIREIQKNTRHFAKRQMTWFRKYAPDHWIDIDEKTRFADVVAEAKSIITAFRGD
ncbi:MAG: tRNA (adenosine(37)-N6)-dimethylallyltransferase MiaA [Candidatus Marinimicrobia bacterium]|nr:tRNA (adenosine(37)-N6)-dimethylallyltransferase MiaA [Candidatus Neomarinimicrobiota bacterium]